jgi:hypothetical protein
MPPALRTFLMWLLMLAISVQGFAAAAMLHCGPGHQRQQHVAAAVDGHEGHAADHGQHGHSGHQASHGMSAAGDDVASDGVASDDSGAPASLAAAKCSACSYCCYATAIVGTLPSVGVAAPDTAPDAVAPPRVEGIVPDGLDRPPRPLLV